MSSDSGQPGWQLQIIKWYPRHRIAYVVVIGGLTILNMLEGAPWWAFWPMFIWGIPFLVHLLFAKCLETDDEWVEERAMGLRSKSYDFGHIRDLESRIGERDFSVEPHSDEDVTGRK